MSLLPKTTNALTVLSTPVPSVVQVTGIRQDRYAKRYRIPVEEDKRRADRGKYLHPELYGMPETMQVDYVESGVAREDAN